MIFAYVSKVMLQVLNEWMEWTNMYVLSNNCEKKYPRAGDATLLDF